MYLGLTEGIDSKVKSKIILNASLTALIICLSFLLIAIAVMMIRVGIVNSLK